MVPIIVLFVFLGSWSLHLRKNRLHIAYVSDSIQQEGLSVSLKLLKYIFDQ